MQMAITGRYVFPPIEPEDVKLYGADTELKESLLNLNQLTEGKETKIPRDISLESNFMFFNIFGMARQPPVDVLKRIEQLDKLLRLGIRLRQSREKDFLMEMVAVSGDSWSEKPGMIWWIVEIVCEEPDTLTYLPRGCICELLLLAYFEPILTNTDEKIKYSHSLLLQQVPRLLYRLRVRS